MIHRSETVFGGGTNPDNSNVQLVAEKHLDGTFDFPEAASVPANALNITAAPILAR